MNTNTILRWSIIGGVLLILFIPLFVSDNLFFPFITGKNFAFRILVEIIFALWLILALRDPSARPRKSLLLYAALAFLVVIGVSDIFAANPDKAFWSNFERMEGWVGLSHLVAYFVVLFSTFSSAKPWKVLWNTAIGVSVLEGIYGLCQLAGWVAINQGGVRVDGRFGNATYLAVYMLFSLFMTALALLWWGRWRTVGEKFLTVSYAVAMLLQLVMIFYTATRGTILGLVGGLFIAGCTFLLFANESPRLRRFGTSAVIALLVLAGGFIAVRNTAIVQHNEVLSRLAGIATPSSLLQEGSTRFAIWGMAWKGFLERPVLGWGQEGFNFVFNKYYQPSLYAQEPWFDRAHDEFIDWLVAGGAVGFLIYLSLFAFALWYVWRPGSVFSVIERGLLTGLLAAYAFHNLFVFDNLVSYYYFFTILAYIAYREQEGRNIPVPGWWQQSFASSTTAIASLGVVVVMAGVFYFVNVPGIATASDIIQGLSQHPEGITVNFDYFKKAVANGGLGLQETREQLVQFAIQVKNLNAGDATFQTQVAEFADQQMGMEIAGNPNDARLRVFYGDYLLQLGRYDDARVQLLKAHDLSPGKQQVMFELTALEATAGNGAAAVNWAKQAYDLDTNYDSARLLYASVAIRTGNTALASSLLMPRYGTLTPDQDTILAAYLAVKDFQSAFSILRTRVANDPSNAQVHIQFAGAYLQAGDSGDAILEIQKAIAIDPSLTSQGNAAIQQIQSGQNPLSQ